MALSGSFSGSYRGWTLKTEWTATQSAANNQSTVVCTHKLVCAAGYDLYVGGSTLTCVIGNVTKTINYSAISSAGGETITLGKTTHVITHDADGKANLSASSQMSSSTLNNIKATGIVALNQIARLSTVELSGNKTLNSAQTLEVTMQSTAYTHTISYRCGTESGTIATKSTAESIEWTPPLSLASQNTAGTTVQVQITISTMSGDISIGSNMITVTLTIPSSVKPTCTIALSDDAGCLSTYEAYVQGKSKLKVVITATLAHESQIASYKTTFNSSTYTGASFTAPVTKDGELTVSVTVTDKRGRSGTATATINVLPYAVPSIATMNVYRCNADGTKNGKSGYLCVLFDAAISPLNNKNIHNYSVRYKKVSDPDSAYEEVAVTGLSYTASGATCVFEADKNSAYNIALVVQDAFTASTKSMSGKTIDTFWSFFANFTGLALNKVAELAGWFDVNWDTIFRKSVWMNRYDDEEKSIRMQNDAARQGKTYESDGIYPHDCKLCGGDGSSTTGIGLFDILNNRGIAVYDDVNDYFKIGGGSTRLQLNGKNYPLQVQHGRQSVSVTAANTVTEFSITFPSAFAGTPDVVITPLHNSNVASVMYKLKTITAAKATGYIISSGTGTHQICWIAMYN